MDSLPQMPSPLPDQSHDLEDQAPPSEAGTPNPSLPDTAPLDHDSTDDGMALYDMFRSPTDRNTSNSFHSSIALSQDDLDNAGRVDNLDNVDRDNTVPTPPVAEIDSILEKQASTSSWVLGNTPLLPPPIPKPKVSVNQPWFWIRMSFIRRIKQIHIFS